MIYVVQTWMLCFLEDYKYGLGLDTTIKYTLNNKKEKRKKKESIEGCS